MASGSGLATALAAIKAHAASAAVIGALVVGGGAATAAVATGTVQVPGISGHQAGSQQGSDNNETPRAQACTNNGDVARLAAIYAPMFGNGTTTQKTQDKAKTAEAYICTLFASGSSGHRAFGLGEVEMLLETTAAIERNKGNTTCITASAAHGQPTQTGKPANPGNSGHAGTPAAGQSSVAIPSASASSTENLIKTIISHDAQGKPLAQIARDCGADPLPGAQGGHP